MPADDALLVRYRVPLAAVVAVLLLAGVIGAVVVSRDSDTRPSVDTPQELSDRLVDPQGWVVEKTGSLDLDTASRRYTDPARSAALLREHGFLAGYERDWVRANPPARIAVVMYALSSSAQAGNLLAALAPATAGNMQVAGVGVDRLQGAFSFSRTTGNPPRSDSLVLFRVGNVYAVVSEAVPGTTVPADEAAEVARTEAASLRR